MSGRNRIGILFPLLLIVMIGGGSAFVWVQTKPVPPPPQPYQGGYMGLTGAFYMSPVTIDAAATTRATATAAVATRPATDLEAARAAWREFITNAGSDPECARLVGRMYGGLPAEVVVVDGTVAQAGGATMYLPPSAGHYVGMRISSLSVQEMAVNRLTVLAPNVSVGLSVYVPDRNQTIGGTGYWPSGGTIPLDEMLSVLADDYFLRHGRPWMLQHGQLTVERFSDAAAARRKLDLRIKKLADAGEQMYGGLKPK